MVVDMNNYDVLLRLNFLIKIGAILDVEQGLIQVRHGPRANVEVLPLTMVNLLQRMNSEALMWDITVILENTHISGDFDIIIKFLYQYSPIMPKGSMHLLHIQTLILIIVNIVMKGITKLSRLMMRMSLKVLSLKIRYCQKDHNRFYN